MLPGKVGGFVIGLFYHILTMFPNGQGDPWQRFQIAPPNHLIHEMSPQFWLGLQMDYDLDVTADMMGSRLERKVGSYALVAVG